MSFSDFIIHKLSRQFVLNFRAMAYGYLSSEEAEELKTLESKDFKEVKISIGRTGSINTVDCQSIGKDTKEYELLKEVGDVYKLHEKDFVNGGGYLSYLNKVNHLIDKHHGKVDDDILVNTLLACYRTPIWSIYNLNPILTNGDSFQVISSVGESLKFKNKFIEDNKLMTYLYEIQKDANSELLDELEIKIHDVLFESNNKTLIALMDELFNNHEKYAEIYNATYIGLLDGFIDLLHKMQVEFNALFGYHDFRISFLIQFISKVRFSKVIIEE